MAFVLFDCKIEAFMYFLCEMNLIKLDLLKGTLWWTPQLVPQDTIVRRQQYQASPSHVPLELSVPISTSLPKRTVPLVQLGFTVNKQGCLPLLESVSEDSIAQVALKWQNLSHTMWVIYFKKKSYCYLRLPRYTIKSNLYCKLGSFCLSTV